MACKCPPGLLKSPSSVSNPDNQVEYFASLFEIRALRPILAHAVGTYDIVILDNQVGFSSTALAAGRVSTKGVVVSEPDVISSDAVKNFYALMGTSRPAISTELLNKIEIRDREEYRNRLQAHAEANLLPPLLFDFGVRRAFGNRSIPVNLENPTSYTIALFTMVKELLPEKRESAKRC